MSNTTVDPVRLSAHQFGDVNQEMFNNAYKQLKAAQDAQTTVEAKAKALFDTAKKMHDTLGKWLSAQNMTIDDVVTLLQKKPKATLADSHIPVETVESTDYMIVHIIQRGGKVVFA